MSAPERVTPTWQQVVMEVVQRHYPLAEWDDVLTVRIEVEVQAEPGCILAITYEHPVGVDAEVTEDGEVEP